jgi:hypothetical protein
MIKPNRCTNFANLFGMKLCMFRTVRLSFIRSLFTVHSAMVYVIQVCRQLSSRSICSCSKARKPPGKTVGSGKKIYSFFLRIYLTVGTTVSVREVPFAKHVTIQIYKDMKTSSTYRSRKSIHSSIFRLMQKYLNVHVFILIWVKRSNATSVILFVILDLSLFLLGSRGRAMGLIWVAAQKGLRNPGLVFIWCVSCIVVVLICFVLCGWLYMGVFWQFCGCLFTVLYWLYCVLYCFFYVYLFLFVLSLLV